MGEEGDGCLEDEGGDLHCQAIMAAPSVFSSEPIGGSKDSNWFDQLFRHRSFDNGIFIFLSLFFLNYYYF